MVKVGIAALVLLSSLAPLASAQSLGIGWAGLGAGFRYWVPQAPWGLQAGGLIFTDASTWGDGGVEEGGYDRSEFISWGANVLYRFNAPEARPNVYLNVNVEGRQRHEESKNCVSRPGPTLVADPCTTESSTVSTVGLMLLGGLEFTFFERFSLAAEVGVRFERQTHLGQDLVLLSLGPGIGVAFLFYAF